MSADSSVWCVYLLECADGTFYCGTAKDLVKRVQQHNAGKGSKYVRSRRPAKLVVYSDRTTKSKALRGEASVKKLRSDQKWNAVRNLFR